MVMMRVAWRATSAGDEPRRGAGGDEGLHRALAAAVDDDRIAGLQQVGGHGFPHQPEADESDGFWHVRQYSHAEVGCSNATPRRARRVLFFARYEASQLGSASIGSEHLLLGILRDGGVHAQAFAGATLEYVAVRQELADAVAGNARIATSVEMPFAAAAKAALEAAAQEADRLKDPYIGTEHLLLALLHESGTVVAGILGRAGSTARRAARGGAPAHRCPGPAQRHIVLVQVTIRPEMRDEFAAALLHNARESVRHDPGCLRFDVSQDKERLREMGALRGLRQPRGPRAPPPVAALPRVRRRGRARPSWRRRVSKCAGRHVT